MEGIFHPPMPAPMEGEGSQPPPFTRGQRIMAMPAQQAGTTPRRLWTTARLLMAPLLFAAFFFFALPQTALADDWADWTADGEDSASFTFANGINGTIELSTTACGPLTAIMGVTSLAHDVSLNYPNLFYAPVPPDPVDFVKILAESGSASPECGQGPVVGVLTITFSEPVQNPIFHFYNLGSSEYRFLDGVTIQRLAGNDRFSVLDPSVNDAPILSDEPGCGEGEDPRGACGSVRVPGTFTEIQLEFTDINIDSAGDEHALTISLLTPPLQLCTAAEVRATQRYWFFGYSSVIDFGTSGTTATLLLGNRTTLEGSTVVTDFSGQLLFWSNGQYIFGSNGNIMANGDLLAGNASATQTVAAFPAIGQPGKYFVVTNSTDVGDAPTGDLHYSIVDMTANSGQGAVIAKNVPLGTLGTASEALTAVPNADGTGFWVLTYTNNTPDFLAYAFDANGPVGDAVISVLPTSNGSWYGTLNFNEELNQLVALTGHEGGSTTIRLLDFDAESGQVIEILSWELPTGDDTGYSGYSADFSPNSDYVYATKIFDTGYLYRYRIADATTGFEVKATEETLGSIGENGGQVRRAPDGRMYIADYLGPYLSVVNDPDNPGNPGFDPLSLELPDAAGSLFGLPQTVTGCPPPVEYDFGDAPVSYGTLLDYDGARHIVSAGATAYLGAAVDIDADGQPSSNADGDDTNGDTPDDEDGVAINPALGYATPTLRTGLDPLSLQPLTNTLIVTPSVDGYVSVWVDWDNDGDFDDMGEQPVNAQAVTPGANVLVFAQSTNPISTTTYLRVRYSTIATDVANPIGAAADGEVEDYFVQVERYVLPDACTDSGQPSYAFTFTSLTAEGNGARYPNVSVINGVPVDMVVEVIEGAMNTGTAPPNGFLIGDGTVLGTNDAQWQINSDATIRYHFVEAGTSTPIPVNAVFTVSDMDGIVGALEIAIFQAADLASFAITQGSAVTINENDGQVSFTGNGNWSGDLESRFQVVLEGISTFDVRWLGGSNSGFGFDGDGGLSISPPACEDWGDAPDTFGTDSTSHTVVPGVFLGTQVDFDTGGRPTENADGDDTARIDDEDALSGLPRLILADSPAPSGSTIELPVPCAPDGAFVVGYIDLDGDSTFGTGHDRSETATCIGGMANLIWTLQDNTVTGKNTYLRLRIALDSAEIQSPTGAATSGEVEDYRVILEPQNQTAFELCDARAFLFQDSIRSNGYAVNLVTGAAPLIFDTMANETNAIGYNQIDNFIWGSCRTGCPITDVDSPNGYLTRVDAAGVNMDFGPIPGLDLENYYIGDVRPDGLLFLTNSGDRMHVVDLRPTSLTYLTVISDTQLNGYDGAPEAGVNVGGADWAFHPGNGQLYSVVLEVDANDSSIRYGRLLRINPETGEITNLGLLRNSTNTANANFSTAVAGWGAVYFDSAGYFYISENTSGAIHRVNLTDPSLPNQYRAVHFADGPSSGSNDGALCNNASLPIDMGDAPDTYGTTFDANGARHDRSNNTGLFLGAAVDTENDGQPSDNADGDDTNGLTPDDEDGVTFNTIFAPGQSVEIPVQVSGTGGRLHVWFDWNQDGDFADADEKAVDNLAVTPGVNDVTINVPGTAQVGNTYARFRLTTQTTLGPTGPAPDGEVEDYVVSLGNPELSSTKRDQLLDDVDGSGTASPGDILRYTVIITNSGVGMALNTNYTDALDPNTTLLFGSVSTSQGDVITGNGQDDSSIVVAVGDMQANSTVTIVYDVVINNPLPVGVIMVSNQGIVSVENPNIPDVRTCDADLPCDPTNPPPTDTPISAAPKLEADKHDTLLIDEDNNGSPSPGDTLLYNITVINSGNQAATGVVSDDTPDPNTQIVPGSVRTNLGSVTDGNDAGDTTISVDVGEIPAGHQLEISYHVVIDADLPETVTELRNQGVVRNDNDTMPCPEEGGAASNQSIERAHCPEILTNDPATPAANDPTITVLERSPTAEEPTQQPGEPRSIFLPQIDHRIDE